MTYLKNRLIRNRMDTTCSGGQGPDYGSDQYWDTELYNQDSLQFQYVLLVFDNFWNDVSFW